MAETEKNEHLFEIPGYSEAEVGRDVAQLNKDRLREKEGRPLQFQGIYIDLIPECGFNCEYCFKNMNEGQQIIKESKEPHSMPKERLTFEQIKAIIDFAKERGVEVITFAGAGEPTRDPDLDRILDYIKVQGLKSMVFTNGERVTEERARKMLETGHVLIKRDSTDDTTQNEISRRWWASGLLRSATEKFLRAREELPPEIRQEHKLGIDTPITSKSISGLPALLRYCRNNDLIPYFEAFIHLGKTKEEIKKLKISPEELQKAFEDLQKIDEEEFGIKTIIEKGARVYGQPPCGRGAYMFSVRTNGDIFPCISAIADKKRIGNINTTGSTQKSLEDAFNYTKHPELQAKMSCSHCSVACAKRSDHTTHRCAF